MEPTEALIQAELSMRELIRTVLGDSWKNLPGIPDAGKIEDRRRGEAISRQGVRISQDSLDYLYIGELKTVFDQRRGEFGDVFEDKSRFNELVRILVAYRNTPFHARSLTWFESDLVTGASGWIVANITHWRNNQAGREGDYPEILSITDDTNGAFVVATNGMVYQPPDLGSLSVGQTVNLTCQGMDADERPLVWKLYRRQPVFGVPIAEAKGASARLTWTPTLWDVSPAADLYITLSADDDYSHRYGDFDAIGAGRYAVLRPRTPKPRPSVL